MKLSIIAAALSASWIVSLASARLRIPDIVGFLGIGLLFGPFGVGLVHVAMVSSGVETVVAIAASILLYEGGRGVDLVHLFRSGWLGLTLLVTLGVLLTSALAACAAHALFSWDWQTAVLLGAVIAATDPAAVIPVMRQTGMAERVSNVAQAESALNDATGAILTLVILGVVQGGPIGAPRVTSVFAFMALGGIAIGFAAAVVTAWVAHGARLRDWGLGADNQQVLELTTVLLAYGAATYVGSSGFMAAFVAGAVHGRTVTRAAYRTEPFFSSMSFLARVAVFVILGATMNPVRAAEPVAATLLFIVAFMLVIRPIAVFASILPDRKAPWTLPELLMLSWVRETGVIPAALAAHVAALSVAHAEEIVAKTAAVVFGTVIVQGLTTGLVARGLRLTKPAVSAEPGG